MNLMYILTTLFAVIAECFILIYYSNGTMNYRYSRFRSNIGIIAGFAVYGVMCFSGNIFVNVIGFVTVTYASLYVGFSENKGSLILKTAILTILMMVSELLVSLYFKVDFENSYNNSMTILEDIIFTLSSKIIYCIAIIVLKNVSVKRNKIYPSHNIVYFMILPISTFILLNCLGKVCSELSTESAILVLTAMTALIISNFVIYIAYDKMIDNILKIDELQKINHKEKLDRISYNLIKEKYDELRIMVHDFNNYCSLIEGEISESSPEALSVINKIRNRNKEFLLVEYTENKALNILLSQKMEMCNKENIDFQIYVQNIDLSFMDEMDIIAVFANLIDNAYESCLQASERKIFLKIYAMNNTYAIIRIDNSAEREPEIKDGVLITKKEDKERHGLGISSVKKALKKYDGHLKWSYDEKKRLFRTTIMLAQKQIRSNAKAFLTDVAE